MSRAVVKRGAVVVVLFAIAFVLILVTMNRSFSVYDEGLVVTGTMRVAAGEIPHRDFYANYGPAQFYVVKLLFGLFGPSVMTERVWDICVKAAIATLVFVVVRGRSPLPAALAGYMACSIWLAAVGNFGYPLFPGVLFALAAAGLVASDLEHGRNVGRIAGAGACVGLTTLFRYDVGALIGTALTVVIVSSAILGRRSWRVSAASMLLFACGTFAIVGPATIVYLVAGGTIQAFVEDVIHGSIYQVEMRRLPFPSLDDMWGDPTTIAVYVPPAVFAVALFLAAWRKRNDTEAWTVAVFVGACLALYVKGWVRMSVTHTSGALIFALVLLPIIWSNVRGQLRVFVAICAVFVAVPTFFALNRLIANAEGNRSFVAGLLTRRDLTCDAPAHLRRVACLRVDAQWSEAVKFLIETVPSEQRLFSGVTRHDKIFINDIMIYFATQRLPATRWHHFDPGLQTRADVQNAMAAELDQRAVGTIVLESDWDNIAEPNASAVSSGVTVLDDYIRIHYETIKRFGTITVLSRRK